MSESITESKTHRIPTAAELGIDLEALRKRYAEERERRLRSDGNRQYQEITGKFAHFNDDPYVKPGLTRPALEEELDVLVVGGG